MVCPNCRSNISDNASFCPVCGLQIPHRQPQNKVSGLEKSAWFAPVFVIVNAVITILGVFLSCILLDTDVTEDPYIIEFSGSLHAVAEPMINVAVNLLGLAMCTLLFYAAVGKQNFKKYLPAAYFPFVINLLVNSMFSLVAYALWIKIDIPFYLTKIEAAGAAAIVAALVSYFAVRSYLKNSVDQR